MIRPSLSAPLRRPAIWIGLLTFILYLPSAARVLQLGADEVEYIDIARRLAAGEGYLLGVKAFHTGGTQVLHHGLAERPPLFPLVAAGLLDLGLGPVSIQVMNALLAGVSAGLVCALGARVFGSSSGLLAGLLVSANPVVLERLVPPMAEALAIALTLMATWLMVRFGDPPRSGAFALAGAMLGLGYLTRPSVVSVIVALAVGLVLLARDRRAVVAPLVALVAGVALFVVPISTYSLATRGSLSYSGQDYLYAVFSDADVMHSGYGPPLPGALEFIAAQPQFVAAAVVQMVARYLGLLFLDDEWLLAFLPVWPMVLLALARGAYPRSAWLLLLAAAANFATYALTWSTFQPRYQLLTLLLLLPFGVDGLRRLGLDRLRLPGGGPVSALHLAVIGLAIYWLPVLWGQYRGEFRLEGQMIGTRVDDGLVWTGPAAWVNDRDLSATLQWIDARAGRNEVLASGEPWVVTFFSGRPATLLPYRLEPERLRSFLVDHQVAYVLLDSRDRPRRAYREYLEALAASSVQSNVVGNYRVYDTRPLWQRPA